MDGGGEATSISSIMEHLQLSRIGFIFKIAPMSTARASRTVQLTAGIQNVREKKKKINLIKHIKSYTKYDNIKTKIRNHYPGT